MMIPLSTDSKQDFCTPGWFREALDARFDFGLDAAATVENRICEQYFGPGSPWGEDALRIRNWSLPNRDIFCNPPYAAAERACRPNCKKKRCQKRGWHRDDDYWGVSGFMIRGWESVSRHTVFLLPASTGTKWFRKFAPMAHVEFISPRMAFETEPGIAMPSPPHASMLIVFGAHPPPRPQHGKWIQISDNVKIWHISK